MIRNNAKKTIMHFNLITGMKIPFWYFHSLIYKKRGKKDAIDTNDAKIFGNQGGIQRLYSFLSFGGFL